MLNNMKTECKKFIPNIFHKAKCANCFHQKEEHTAEALESNRSLRKISKCGYLFVAPGWDFSNPLNRTKRWQRRWFVLYDDGELSYALDEHPETIPQAHIDMNQVLDVSDAEEITGNSYSIAITAPDAIHFVKGTCREEAKWWKNVLSIFPQSKDRLKRNTLFPRCQSPSSLQQTTLSCTSIDYDSKFNSISTNSDQQSTVGNWVNVTKDILPAKDVSQICRGTSDSSTIVRDSRQDYSSDSNSKITKSFKNFHEIISSPPSVNKTFSEESVNNRQNKEKNSSKIEKSFSEEFFQKDKYYKSDNYFDKELIAKNNRLMKADVSNRNATSGKIFLESENYKKEEHLKEFDDSLTRPKTQKVTNQSNLISLKHRSLVAEYMPPRGSDCLMNDSNDKENNSIKTSALKASFKNEVDSAKEKSIRGDPDGCGLDITIHRYSPRSELHLDFPTKDLTNIKKGWLFKQDNRKKWSKHWFVLRGVALMYYRDPAAEDKGILDGVLDLSSIKSVFEIQALQNYGFEAVFWDDKRYILSAATPAIRVSWIEAIRKTAGLIEQNDKSSVNVEKTSNLDGSLSEVKNAQFFESNHSSQNLLDSNSQKAKNDQFIDSCVFSVIQTSQSSKNNSQFFKSQVVETLFGKSVSDHHTFEIYQGVPETNYRLTNSKEKDKWNKSPAPLPPSPPLNRTPISKVKEKAKIQITRSKVYNKRSKSSPPCLRKNALDFSRTLDSLFEEKRDEPIKRSMILDKVDRHVKEIDELKGQLNLALCERSTAEKELTRLRQRKSEANQQVEELLKNLKVAENELKLKTQELENFESLKQRYSALVKEHEGMLRSWRESAINDGWREMYQQLKEEYAKDKETWEIKLADVTSLLHGATERCEMLRRELFMNENTIEALKTELTNLSERLLHGIEENEGLYGRMRELEGRCLSSSSRERGRSVESLSDLTNIDLDIDLDTLDKDRIIEEYEELKGRFEKAIQEIRAMKKELRESQANYDDLELIVINLRQDSKRREENGKAQAALMASRIEDLTLKLSAAEKQSRLLKQKIIKSETREKRRSLSLKGKESFCIGKETEEKLVELEAKINALESGKPLSSVIIKTASPTNTDVKSTRLRRKSLESISSVGPMKILVRIFSLERKIAKAAGFLNPKFIEADQIEKINLSQNEEISEVMEKMMECKSIISDLKKNCFTSTSKILDSLELYLTEIQELFLKYFRLPSLISKSCTMQLESALSCAIKKMESFLKTKIIELQEKKQELIERNLWDAKAKLQLIAEKLAYESVLIQKIVEGITESTFYSQQWGNAINLSEIYEVNLQMTILEQKIKNENLDFTGKFQNELSKKIACTIFSEGELIGSSYKNLEILLSANEKEIELKQVYERQKAITDLTDKYIKKKIKEIATSIAFEMVYLGTEKEEEKKNKLEKRIQNIRTMAKEALSRELALTEIPHIIMKCLLLYENAIVEEHEGRLTWIAEKYKRQEDYLQKVDESFRNSVDEIILNLNIENEKIFKNLEAENTKNIKYNDNWKTEMKKHAKEGKSTIENLCFVLIYKKIIDARICFLKEEPFQKLILHKCADMQNMCLKRNKIDPNFETKFIYLYQKFKEECLQWIEYKDFSSKKLIDLKMTLRNCTTEVNNLRVLLGLPETLLDVEADFTVGGTWDKCNYISSNLTDIVNSIKEKLSSNRRCILDPDLHKMEVRYNEEIKILKNSYEKEIKDLRIELESQKNSLICQHEQQQAQLIEKTKRLERRLETLDVEYSRQVDNLKNAYYETLSTDLVSNSENAEDSIRQRYQAEIEQLRTLCEKGLIAVDNSHRRIIAELEEKHRQEMAAAEAEKEQALAEETQATLAALDAMRKAHEIEVQKEINKFKSEFLKKMQSSHDIGALHQEHEKEIEEIRKEILSLSEKYSVKCVESASLEEQLSQVSKQLNQAQEHILQLDAKNKQLRAHIVSENRKPEDSEKFLSNNSNKNRWNLK